MLVFFATLILLATLLYPWETRARLRKFCHPFYQSLWHFLPVQVFSGEMTPPILQSCSTTMGRGLLRATERVSREVTTALGKPRPLAPSWGCWAETHCYVHLAVVGPGC
jgi:hypothetical protein